MPRETPAERVRREQREIMERLNRERDKKLTVRQQNDIQTRNSAPMPKAAKTPQGTGPSTLPMGGLAGRAQAVIGNRGRQVDAAVNRATGYKKK